LEIQSVADRESYHTSGDASTYGMETSGVVVGAAYKAAEGALKYGSASWGAQQFLF